MQRRFELQRSLLKIGSVYIYKESLSHSDKAEVHMKRRDRAIDPVNDSSFMNSEDLGIRGFRAVCVCVCLHTCAHTYTPHRYAENIGLIGDEELW